MLILSEFQIEFTLPGPTAMVALLHLHPSLLPRLRSGNELLVESLGVPFPPNTVIPPPTILIHSATAALASWLPLDILGFPAGTSSRPNRFPMSSTPVQSRCLLRIFPQRFCGFSCRAGIAKSTNSALLPTASSDPPSLDGNAR
jgi:hypothetical protein